MLEKTKKWVKENGTKVKDWYDRNKMAIGFGVGCAAATGVMMILGKMSEPVRGYVSFDREDQNDNNIIARVWGKDRLDRERELIAIDYSDDGEIDIRNISEKLNDLIANKE